jgi:hypothetical protein
MNRLMEEIIMGQPEGYDIDAGAKLHHAVQAGLTGTAMWNGNVPPPPNYTPPGQTKRVVVRPKVKAL